MAIQDNKFSSLNAVTRDELNGGHKLVAVAGSGSLGRNLNVNLQELRAPGLPVGYKLCAYVASNGHCYVDTGVPSSEKVGFQLTYQYQGSRIAAGEVIIGAGVADTVTPANSTRQWINESSSNQLCVGWGANLPHGIATSNSIAYGQVNFMMSNTATVNLPNAKDLQLGYDAKFSGWNLYLFACNGSSGGTYTLPTVAHLYRCRISEGRRVVRDFIPVRHTESGRYGLYEAIEGKVYYPGAGALTGAELNSVWDYSHFAGAEGAYIDDYPTPDSPNFVKASGVEAGMAQIREALMVGPMTPTPGYTTTDYKGRFVPFLSGFQYATIPVPQSATDYPKNASGFINIPNFNLGDTEIAGASTWLYTADLLFGINENAYSFPIKRISSSTCGLGNTSTRYKSVCAILGKVGAYSATNAGPGIIPFQSNCDFVVHYKNSNHLLSAALASASFTNSTTRMLGAASAGLSALYVPGQNTTACSFLFYVPTTTIIGGSAIQGAANSQIKKNTTVKFYLPSLSKASTTSNTLIILMANNNPSASSVTTVSYLLKYLARHSDEARSITTGIDDQYFSIGDGQTKPTGTITYSNYVLDKTTGTVAVDATDGTNSCTYTLLPNDHPIFGEECRQLRETLWNTNGVNGTSTGLLDGVIQVGPNAGTPYANYWSLQLRPIAHSWTN